MSEKIKNFRVLENIFVRTSNYTFKPIALEQEIIRVEVVGDIYKWKNYRHDVSQFKEWERLGYIKEILPDKKPIISGGVSTEEFTNNLKLANDVINEKSDSILDYEKKYNIYQAVHLMKNNDVTMIDSHFKIEWMFKNGHRTFVSVGTLTEIDYFFDESFGVFDLLDLTFMLVKPVEVKEAKENWVEIKNDRELCHSIVNKNTIKVTDEKFYEEDDGDEIEVENYGAITFKPPFTTETIDRLYDYKHMFRYKIEYLEEK